MLTEVKMDRLLKMLDQASLEQLDVAWARIVVAQSVKRPCIILGLPLIRDPGTDEISGAAQTWHFEDERSDCFVPKLQGEGE